MSVVLRTFSIVSIAIGAMGMLVLLGLLSGVQVPSTWSRQLFIGAMAVCLPPVFVIQLWGLQDLPMRDRTKFFYAGLSGPQKATVYTVSLAALAIGVIDFLIGAIGGTPIAPSEQLFHSVFVVFVAPAAAGQLHSYSNIRDRLKATHCPRGHRAPPEARYCPVCGYQLRPDA